MKETYGAVLPQESLDDLVGKLIVIEGTDGVGRSTQIRLLKEWLEQQGHAVLDTGLSRSGLVGKSIKRAKEGHTLGRITLSLFYTTDFADRLENEIIPALRAGFVVLTDRYIYSLIARAMVRGLDPAWVRNIHRFALKPDAVFYLRIGLDDLIPRAVFTRGFDYWESGMDFYSTEDMYDSFRRYQTAMLERFDQLAEEFQFNVIDAKPEPAVIFEQLREGILKVLVSREPAEAKPSEAKPAEAKPAEVKPAEVKPAAKTAPSAAASAANPPAAVPAEAPPGDVVAVSVPEAGGAAEERRNQIAKAR
jgi:dTMP kinase